MRIGTEYLTNKGWVNNPIGHKIACLNTDDYSIEWNQCDSVVAKEIAPLYEIKVGKTLNYCCNIESQLLFFSKQQKIKPLSNLLYRWSKNSIVVHGRHLTAFDNNYEYESFFRAKIMFPLALVLLFGQKNTDGTWRIKIKDLPYAEVVRLQRKHEGSISKDKKFINIAIDFNIEDIFSISSFQASQLFNIISQHSVTDKQKSYWKIPSRHLDHVQIISIYSSYTTNIKDGHVYVHKKNPNISLKRGVRIGVVHDSSIYPEKLNNCVTRYNSCVTSIHRG